MVDVKADYFSWKERNGYSQHDTAKLIGCSRSTIAAWECGRSPLPKGETVLSILSILYPGWDREGRKNDHTCPNCNGSVPGPAQNASHCCECGHQFGRICTSCKTVNPVSGKFCAECGSRLP